MSSAHHITDAPILNMIDMSKWAPLIISKLPLIFRYLEICPPPSLSLSRVSTAVFLHHREEVSGEFFKVRKFGSLKNS